MLKWFVLVYSVRVINFDFQGFSGSCHIMHFLCRSSCAHLWGYSTVFFIFSRFTKTKIHPTELANSRCCPQLKEVLLKMSAQDCKRSIVDQQSQARAGRGGRKVQHLSVAVTSKEGEAWDLFWPSCCRWWIGRRQFVSLNSFAEGHISCGGKEREERESMEEGHSCTRSSHPPFQMSLLEDYQSKSLIHAHVDQFLFCIMIRQKRNEPRFSAQSICPVKLICI